MLRSVSVVVCQNAIYSEARCWIAESRLRRRLELRPGPGRRRTGVTQIHVKGKGDMPEPLRVFANLSGSAHAGRWMHRPQQGQVMKIFEPVALRLQHLAESDRERQRHITLVGPTTSLAQGISARRQQARACLAAASFAAVCPSMTSRWVRAKSIAVPR